MQVQLSCTAGESVDSASHYSNPAPFYDRKPSREPVWERLRGGVASHASRQTRTRTQLAKSLCHHLIDNNCKSTALRALHAQDIVAEAAHSKTASPIVAEAAQ